MHFSQQAESILQELHKKMAEKEDIDGHVDNDHDDHNLSKLAVNE